MRLRGNLARPIRKNFIHINSALKSINSIQYPNPIISCLTTTFPSLAGFLGAVHVGGVEVSSLGVFTAILPLFNIIGFCFMFANAAFIAFAIFSLLPVLTKPFPL